MSCVVFTLTDALPPEIKFENLAVFLFVWWELSLTSIPLVFFRQYEEYIDRVYPQWQEKVLALQEIRRQRAQEGVPARDAAAPAAWQAEPPGALGPGPPLTSTPLPADPRPAGPRENVLSQQDPVMSQQQEVLHSQLVLQQQLDQQRLQLQQLQLQQQLYQQQPLQQQPTLQQQQQPGSLLQQLQQPFSQQQLTAPGQGLMSGLGATPGSGMGLAGAGPGAAPGALGGLGVTLGAGGGLAAAGLAPTLGSTFPTVSDLPTGLSVSSHLAPRDDTARGQTLFSTGEFGAAQGPGTEPAPDRYARAVTHRDGCGSWG